jgi:Ser/Thr protein kinase RdoA (MazF antagonist)
VKIIAGEESATVIDAENQLLEYAIAHGFTADLPTIVRNQYEQSFTRINMRNDGVYHAQLMVFLEGNLLQDISDISQKQFFLLGQMMAEFNRTLQGYDHPVMHRKHIWDVSRADQHVDKIKLIESPETRELVTWAFDQWKNKASPFLLDLPHQVIHGDANGENVLVNAGKISGLIDFTDCCYNPTVCELAICLTYAMMDQADPMAVFDQATRGYESARPLSEPETAVLQPLIHGRLAMSICVSSKRRTIDPNHPNWFRSEKSATDLLRRLR